MKYIPLYLCFLCTTSLTAQYQKIDSLQYLLIEQSPDTLKVKIYQQLGSIYSYINLDTSLYYGELSYEIATQNNWPKEQANSLMEIGYAQFDLGDPRKSLGFFKQAIRIAKTLGDTSLLASVSNGLGLGYWKLRKNEIAIVHLQNAYDWAQQSNNRKVFEFSVNNLGMISDELGRHDQAIAYFEKGKALSEESKDWAGVAISYLNIGVSYQQVKNYEKAYENFQEVLNREEGLAEEKSVIALVYVNIADVLNEQEKYSEALANANKALTLCEKYGYQEITFAAKSSKVRSLLKLNEYQEAIQVAKNTILELEGSAYMDLLPEFEESLSLSYEGEGDYKEALIWQKKYNALQDSLHELNRDGEIARLEISHQTKEKEAENEKLKIETLVQSALVQSRTWLAIVSCLGLLLFSCVAILLFRTRQKLKSMNNHLEEKVIERTEALQEMNTKLYQSNDELKRFAYIASHDLKEPLRNTGGFISLMKRRLQQKDYDSLEEYMNFIERSNYQMVALVNDILEYSRIDGKEITKQIRVDIQDEVKYVSGLLAHIMSNKKAVVYCEHLPKVYCNPSLIRVVLKNLIENGIKYNDSAEPTIHISFERSEKHFKLIITDNGIGIPKDYQEKIFEMFVRLHNRSEYSGSGMGLAFCKKMLISNGGDIIVESAKGKGSTFVVSVALDREPEPVLA